MSEVINEDVPGTLMAEDVTGPRELAIPPLGIRMTRPKSISRIFITLVRKLAIESPHSGKISRLKSRKIHYKIERWKSRFHSSRTSLIRIFYVLISHRRPP